MVFNATFNNISDISTRTVLLVKESGVPEKKNTDMSQVIDKLYHIVRFESGSFVNDGCGQLAGSV